MAMLTEINKMGIFYILYSEVTNMTQDEIIQVPVDAQVQVLLTDDLMKAKLLLTASDDEGKALTEADLLQALEEAGVVYGLNKEVIARMAAEPVYEQEILVAEGLAPIDGQDGQARYLFETNLPLEPKEDEHGNVDFKNLSYVQNILKDQPLVEIYAPIAGTAGINVLGETVEGSDGQPLKDIDGGNTYLSEDGSYLLAKCSGSVIIKKGKVCISRILNVENVDISTGNLLYVGTIVVAGNIGDGFTVSGSEGVVVKGTVENGRVISGRDVVVGRGICGNKAHIIAGGDVRSGFLENCVVEAKGNVYADAILQSDVKSNGEIVVKGRRGCIIGGVCRAARRIEVVTAGNERYIPTHLEVYGTFFLEDDKQELEEKRQKQRERLDSAGKLIAEVTIKKALGDVPPELEKVREDALATQQKCREEIAKLDGQIAEKDEQIKNFGLREIRVSRRLHANVMLDIEGVTRENEDVRHSCVIQRAQDGLVFR